MKIGHALIALLAIALAADVFAVDVYDSLISPAAEVAREGATPANVRSSSPDLDDSGAIDEADRGLVLQYFNTTDARGDANGDGLANILDLTLIQQRLADSVSTSDAAYLIIDVSEGPTATSYPMTGLETLPEPIPDVYKTTKIILRRIPAGTFTMGSPTNEQGRGSDETQHQVTLTQDFYMGVFEVTQKQWERVMGTWPSFFGNVAYRDSRPVDNMSYNMIRGHAAGAGWPGSSAVDAISFMGKLRARTGSSLDLPTEAQWEYACRAGTTTALNSGVNLSNSDQDAGVEAVGRYFYNGGGYDDDISEESTTSTASAAVGSYSANAWGLYDMHGNILELCLDWYAENYGGGVTDPTGPVSGTERVMRGGYWNNSASDCRSATRGGGVEPDFDITAGGFRLSLPVAP